jgi:CBS domain containing-hemolysin-like protein
MFGFIGIFVLLLCSALVSGAEVALFSLSQQDMRDLQGHVSKVKLSPI